VTESLARPGLAARRRLPVIPPNLFSIAFGIAGLADAWDAARSVLRMPAAVPDAIFGLAAALWLALVILYLAKGPRRIAADLRDPVLSPFVAIVVLTPLLLGTGLASVALTAGRVVVLVSLAATVLVGGWLTGQWIAGDLDQDRAHPGYFLPTVAGGLLGAFAAAAVGLHAIAEVSFGIGIICWLVLGSTILNRLFFRPALPGPLTPTLAIEIAPPAVAGIAWFVLNGGRADTIARALGGYAVLMAVVQLRFIPLYARLTFSPGFWAFTFAYAAVATDAELWLAVARPPGAAGYAIAVLILITAFIAAIAVRTVVAVARGQLLPAHHEEKAA
jgi:tellurite resistance protein